MKRAQFILPKGWHFHQTAVHQITCVSIVPIVKNSLIHLPILIISVDFTSFKSANHSSLKLQQHTFLGIIKKGFDFITLVWNAMKSSRKNFLNWIDTRKMNVGGNVVPSHTVRVLYIAEVHANISFVTKKNRTFRTVTFLGESLLTKSCSIPYSILDYFPRLTLFQLLIPKFSNVIWTFLTSFKHEFSAHISSFSSMKSNVNYGFLQLFPLDSSYLSTNIIKGTFLIVESSHNELGGKKTRDVPPNFYRIGTFVFPLGMYQMNSGQMVKKRTNKNLVTKPASISLKPSFLHFQFY